MYGRGSEWFMGVSIIRHFARERRNGVILYPRYSIERLWRCKCESLGALAPEETYLNNSFVALTNTFESMMVFF